MEYLASLLYYLLFPVTIVISYYAIRIAIRYLDKLSGSDQ